MARRSRRTAVIGGLGAVLAATGAALALLAAAGRWSALLDLLAQFAPLIAVLSAAGLLFSLVGRSRPGVVLGAVGVLVCGALIVPEFTRSNGPASPPGVPGQIKVIQFNAWRDNPRRAEVVDWLAREDPDFVLLEESSPALRDALVARTGWSVAGAKTTSMIFSRAPYLVMHRPPSNDRQGFTWVNATYATAGGPAEIVVTHFLRPTQESGRRQVRDMTLVLQNLPRERMILGGDFNATPWSWALRASDSAFGLVRRDRAMPTYPADAVSNRPRRAFAAFMPIDHVYAGSGWATVAVRRGPRLGSDHYPVIVTLAPVAAH